MSGSLRLPIRERVRYEYKCPYCGCRNVRYEECRRIVCDFCRKEFVPHSIIPISDVRSQPPTRSKGGGL